MKKLILSLLISSAILTYAAPPDLGTASGAAAARNGSNVVLPDFLNNLGGTATGKALFSIPSPGTDRVFVTNAGGNVATVATSSLATTSLSWAAITSKPTTLSGYGITDGLVKSSNLADLTNAATARTNLGLGTAATTAATAYATALQGTNADAHAANASNPHSVTKAQVGLGSVENTALSTWAGTSNLTTLGTIGSGTWQGTSIVDAYIASAAAWNAKQSAITFGTGVQTALGVNLGSAGALARLSDITGTNSGTNTGDQTGIVGITGTLSEFNAALTGADFATGGGTATGTNTGDQTITLTGDATGSGTGSFAVNVGKINGTSMAGLSTGILKNTTVTGVPSIAVAGTDYLTPTGDGSGLTGVVASTVTSIGNLTGDVTSTNRATTVGKINGTALSGLATGILKNTTTTGVPSIAVAGTDYVTPAGNVATATALATGRTLAITGDLTWTSPAFDGTGNVTAAGTLANSGVTATSYGSSTAIPVITFDAKGRATTASTAAVVAPAGTLAGATLASGVTASSLTSFGTSPTLTSPSATNLTTDQITLSGNISAPSWATNGIRIKGVPATLTDTTSSGTVATAYTDVLGGNTIAASSATTFTNYVTGFYREPIIGTNVSMTNKWALGAESLRIGTSNHLTISNAGVLAATSPVFVTPTLGASSATSIATGLGTVSTPAYTIGGDLNTGMWSPAADTLAWSANGAEGMRLTTGGLGIGVTPATGSKLHVVGSITNPSALVDANYFLSTITATSGANGFVNNGLNSQMTLAGSQNFTASNRGNTMSSYYGGSAVVTELIGLLNSGGCTSTGNITTFVANRVATFSTGAGTIGTAIGLNVQNMSAYSSPTTVYGIKLEDNTTAAGTSKYGLHIGNISGAATNNYSIYTGTAPSYFGGNIELGHITDTTIARVSAGRISIEGVNVPTISSTDTLTNKSLTAPTFTGTAIFSRLQGTTATFSGGTLNMDGAAGGAGGDISTNSTSQSNGGYIKTSAGSGAGGQGGYIDTSGAGTRGGGAVDTHATSTSTGGNIFMYGGSGSSANGGSINMYGSTGAGGTAGSLTTTGSGTFSGGSIITSASSSAIGGGIDTSSNTTNAGGNIYTYGGSSGVGGAISTFDGGGAINTRGVGSIGMGVAATRTTFVGSATSARTITLPDATDTLVGKATTDTLTNKTLTYGKITSTTVGALTAAATAGLGSTMVVTDSLAPAAGATVAAGGAAKALVMSNGTNWIVVTPL